MQRGSGWPSGGPSRRPRSTLSGRTSTSTAPARRALSRHEPFSRTLRAIEAPQSAHLLAPTGALDPDELKAAFKKMGHPEFDVMAVMAEIDEDGDGEVDIDEFFEWW
jgi:Ca2+-binding EF-hand superfamily protein